MIWEALDWEIGKAGENYGQVLPHGEFQPATAFYDRENRRNLRSACGLPMCIQFLRLSKYFDSRNWTKPFRGMSSADVR